MDLMAIAVIKKLSKGSSGKKNDGQKKK